MKKTALSDIRAMLKVHRRSVRARAPRTKQKSRIFFFEEEGVCSKIEVKGRTYSLHFIQSLHKLVSEYSRWRIWGTHGGRHIHRLGRLSWLMADW